MPSLVRLLLIGTSLLTVGVASPTKLTLAVSDSNGQSFSAVVVFNAHLAFEYGAEIKGPALATYDLHTPGWADRGGNKITLEQAQRWAESSKQRALSSLSRLSDPGQKAFTEMLLSPSFNIRPDETLIRLESQFLSYEASEGLSLAAEDLKKIFAYDELNAYRKAMVLRQSPPFTQLFVSGVLKERSLVPGKLLMRIRTPGGEIEVVTTQQWSALTESELVEFNRHNSP